MWLIIQNMEKMNLCFLELLLGATSNDKISDVRLPDERNLGCFEKKIMKNKSRKICID